MITVHINGKKIEAESGASIIEVADKIGVPIPRFCYHPCLSVAASCRMCLVQVSTSPKPVPACATPVTEGMQIFTHSEETRRAQKTVTEMLLINHPLDCPVCDQAGECELQDLIMQYSADRSHYHEEKREVANPHLGPLIATEMNRCIHCSRCVRFADEVAGLPEMGATCRGEDLKITNYLQRALESEISANMIDLCPVGALTSKPHRFGGRSWSFRSVPGWIGHDGFRSPIEWHTQSEDLKRLVFRKATEQYALSPWLSDRDKFGYLGLQSDDRQKELGFIRHKHYQKASLSKMQQLFKEMSQSASSWGALIHPQASLEDIAAIHAALEQAPHAIGAGMLRSAIADEQWDLHSELLLSSRPKIILSAFATTDHPLQLTHLRQWSDKGGEIACWSFSSLENLHIKNANYTAFAGLSYKKFQQVLKKNIKNLISEKGHRSCDLIICEQFMAHPWAQQILDALMPISVLKCLWHRKPYWPLETPTALTQSAQPELLFIVQAEYQDWVDLEVAKKWISQAKFLIVLGGYRSFYWEQLSQDVLFFPTALLAEQKATYLGAEKDHLLSSQAIKAPQDSQTVSFWLSHLLELQKSSVVDLESWRKIRWVRMSNRGSAPEGIEKSLWFVHHPLNLDGTVRRSQPLHDTPWARRAQGLWVGPGILSEKQSQQTVITLTDSMGQKHQSEYKLCADLPVGTILYWLSDSSPEITPCNSWTDIE